MTDQSIAPLNVLLLGGTTEATALASKLSRDDRFRGVLSLAGRTANPAASEIPTRIGGFGGVQGLADYIGAHAIDVVVDATHPFAAQMSANAIAACQSCACPLVTLERHPWQRQDGDHWINCATVAEAVQALPKTPSIVFSGLGRLSLDELAAAPQHHYIIRLIDPPLRPLALPHVSLIMGRGPFKTTDDVALFRQHSIDFVLAKNAGGTASVSKIKAARVLGLTVMIIDRPFIPPRKTHATVEAVWEALLAHITPPTNLGV